VAPTITPTGKMRLYHATTGRAIERWPVDARAMLACGEYTADPIDGAMPAATVDATPARNEPQPQLTVDPITGTVVGGHPTGAPVVVARAHDAPLAKSVELPVRSGKGWKARAGQ